MSRIDHDETWEKKPDGTMRLLSRVERIVTDEQIAYEDARAQLRALRNKGTWTPADLEAAVRAVARILLPPEADAPPLQPPEIT
jgi:hypothetical protein